MANRYSVIARTYLQDRLVVVFAWWFFMLGAFAVTGRDSPVSTLLFINIFLAVAVLAWVVGAHVKEQLASPRATLLPGFRVPHLIVAATVFLTAFVWMTAVTWWVVGTSLLGTVALLLTILTMILWATYWPSPVLALAPAACALVFMVRQYVAALLEGRATQVAVLLLVICCVLLFELGARLLRLNEDMPEYRLLLPVNLSTPGAERRYWTALQGHWQVEWQPTLFRRCIPWNHDGFWGRVRLWRAGLSPINMATLMPVVFLPAWLVPAAFTGIKEAVGTHLLWMPSMYSGAFLGCMVAAMWLQRWPRLGYELLRPTQRQDFYRQMGCAFALELLEGFLWCALAVGCIIAAVQPSLLRGPDIAVFFALNGIIPLVEWALMAWVISYTRSPIAMIFVVLLGSLPPGFVWLAYLMNPMSWPAEVYLTAALGVVLVSVGVLYLAYRRWLRLDLP